MSCNSMELNSYDSQVRPTIHDVNSLLWLGCSVYAGFLTD